MSFPAVAGEPQAQAFPEASQLKPCSGPDAIRGPRDTPIWTLEASLKCRSCRKGCSAPPARMIKLTEAREITPCTGGCMRTRNGEVRGQQRGAAEGSNRLSLRGHFFLLEREGGCVADQRLVRLSNWSVYASSKSRKRRSERTRVGSCSKSFLPLVMADLAWGLVATVCCLRRIFCTYRRITDSQTPSVGQIGSFLA